MMVGILFALGIIIGMMITPPEKKSNIHDYGCREDFSSRGKDEE